MTSFPSASPTSPARRFRLLSALLAAGLGACSPLKTFNAIVPRDPGVAAIGRDLAFGSDPRQRLDLYRPAQATADSSLPIIVFIYGGSWQSGEKGGYAFAGRALASRGFLVAVPDYRLVPQVRFPSFLEDNAAAVRWVAANARRLGGDPSRIVLVGHSAGAYNAAMLALDPRWLGADRSRVRGFAGLAGPYDFLPFDGPVTRAAFGREPDSASTQPITFASRDDPPTLLLHGTRDTTVLPRNSQQLASRLTAAGASAELRLYPGVGHVGMVTGLARPFRGRAPVLADVADFASRVTATR